MAGVDSILGRGHSRTPRSRGMIVEAYLSWVASLVLFFSTVYVVVKLDFLWAAFGVSALSLYVLPIVSMRDPFKALPWEITVLLSSPLILHLSEQYRALNENIAWWDDFTSIAFAFSLATLGFLLTVELHMYTDVKMNLPLSAFFVVMFTLAVSGFWQIGEYVGDVFFGTNNLLSNEQVMKEFSWAALGGLFMGFVYGVYIKVMSRSRREVLGFMHLWEASQWKRN